MIDVDPIDEIPVYKYCLGSPTKMKGGETLTWDLEYQLHATRTKNLVRVDPRLWTKNTCVVPLSKAKKIGASKWKYLWCRRGKIVCNPLFMVVMTCFVQYVTARCLAIGNSD